MDKYRRREITTKHGVIYYRDALIITDFHLSLAPLELSVTANWNLHCCRPRADGDVDIRFEFTKIRHFCIYLLDEYHDENLSRSEFDEYVDENDRGIGRYVLSTYDHVFDVSGEYRLIYL